jgi:hypothetical protein
MTQRDQEAATDDRDQTNSATEGDDREPKDGTSFQDGSIATGMSSDSVDDTEDGAADGSGDDGDDEGGDANGGSPLLQRKLKEGAEARRKLSELEQEMAGLRTQAKAFETLLKHPNPGELIKQFRVMEGGEGGSFEATPVLPKKDYGFDPEVQKGLEAMLQDALGGMMSRLKGELAPVIKEVGAVKTQRESAEWNSLATKHGEGIGRWKTAAEKLARETGMPLSRALMAVSDGEAATMKAKAKEAAAKAATRVPEITQSRGKMGTRSAAPVATSFAQFLEMSKNKR